MSLYFKARTGIWNYILSCAALYFLKITWKTEEVGHASSAYDIIWIYNRSFRILRGVWAPHLTGILKCTVSLTDDMYAPHKL